MGFLQSDKESDTAFYERVRQGTTKCTDWVTYGAYLELKNRPKFKCTGEKGHSIEQVPNPVTTHSPSEPAYKRRGSSELPDDRKRAKAEAKQASDIRAA